MSVYERDPKLLQSTEEMPLPCPDDSLEDPVPAQKNYEPALPEFLALVQDSRCGNKAEWAHSRAAIPLACSSWDFTLSCPVFAITVWHIGDTVRKTDVLLPV